MRLLLATASTGGLVGLLHNGVFVAAFMGFFFAQSAKVFTHYYTEQKWDFTRLVSSGGMPSSHTGLVRGSSCMCCCRALGFSCRDHCAAIRMLRTSERRRSSFLSSL
jgi:acid phosphatase family membrane protein YuiD